MFVRFAASIVILSLFGAANATSASAQVAGQGRVSQEQTPSGRAVVVGYTADGRPIVRVEGNDPSIRSGRTAPGQSETGPAAQQAIDAPIRRQAVPAT